MVRDGDKKGSLFIVVLVLIVFADMAALTLIEEAPTSLWVAISIIEAISIVSLLLAGRWYSSARAEHEQLEVMGLVLDQLNKDEVIHVLSELRGKPMTGIQKRLLERLIAEHCHIDVHI